MRRIRPVLCLLLLLPLAGSRQDWAWEGKSKHYEIRTTKDKKTGVGVLQYMDLVFETYCKFLNPEPSRLPKKKFTLIVYSGYKEYKSNGGPGRYGHYDGKRLVGYFDEEQMFPTMSHEGMHQFTDICIPNFHRVAAWYSEGIAECIANNEVRRGKLYMCLQDGPVPKIRVPILQKAIEEGTYLPLDELLKTDKRAFQKNHRICYAESWAWCHFLLTYPRYEDKSKRIPAGKYKKVIVNFHNAMLDPKRRASDAQKIALRGLSLEKMEKEFKDWVRKWPVEYEMPKEPYEEGEKKEGEGEPSEDPDKKKDGDD